MIRSVKQMNTLDIISEAKHLYMQRETECSQDMIRFIDKIYDDMDKRICSNCKHYDYGYCSILTFPSDADTTELEVSETFGCSEWEDKND